MWRPISARLGVAAATGSPQSGQDDDARRLAHLVAEAGVAFDAIVDPARPTIVKTRVMSGAHQLLRVDREETRPLPAALEEAILARIEAALSRAQGLVLSDYAKGALTDRVLRGAIEGARARGALIFVDPKRRNFSAYAGATLITPNRGELAAATGLACDSDDDIEAAARKIIQATGAAILVTRSDKGMSCDIAEGFAPIHMLTKARQVFDVSGRRRHGDRRSRLLPHQRPGPSSRRCASPISPPGSWSARPVRRL